MFLSSAGQALYPFRSEGLWGYLDSNGTVVIAPQFQMAGFFHEGLAYAQIGEALGYIDEKGQTAIPSRFPAAFDFNEGFASAMAVDEWGVINRKGEWVISPRFKHPVTVKNGLIRFKSDRGMYTLYGFMNTRGDTVIAPQFEKAGEFNEGLCLASKDGFRYGYINASGQWVIKPVYELGTTLKVNGSYDFSSKDFSSGYAAVEKDEKFGVIDTSGKLVIGFKFAYIGKFSEGLAPAKKDSLYGYIDTRGNWVIKPAFNMAESFHHGLASVAKGPFLEEKWGFINAKGQVVIPFTIYANYQFNLPMQFWQGVVACYLEPGVFGYINRSGTVIWRMDP